MRYIKNLYVSMVTPASEGCNLRCPFCVIDQRGETGNALTSDDYLRFLEGAAQLKLPHRFSIQGHEPLLPGSWGLTAALLDLADDLGDVETGLVTNGTHLAEHAEELSALVDHVVVSLDSPDPAIHDKMRGVSGAHELTISGIREAVPHFGGALFVNSVLIPKKNGHLEHMPLLLSRLGVKEWLITPLTDFRKGRYVEQDAKVLLMTLHTLSENARKYGVGAFLSDELRRFEGENFGNTLSIAGLQPDEYVIRLSPDGSCSRGKEILIPSKMAPHWDGKEDPASFLVRILEEVGVRIC